MKPKESEIEALNISGLQGRLLHLPAPKGKKRTIVLIYGLHSSIERMYTTALFHNQFGSVHMPDLPGFGGMDSFYTIGREPDLDSYADYLYSFLKSRRLTKDITIVSMSFGSLVVTRMLQKYPEVVDGVKDNITIVGFGRGSDFNLPSGLRWLIIGISKVFKTRFGAWLVKALVFNRWSLQIMFAFFRLFNPKYKLTLGEQRREALAMETDLWSKNDARTKFYTWDLILNFDLTRNASPIALSVHNMYTSSDQYFSAERVEASLQKLYASYQGSLANSELHAPSVLGSLEEIETLYSTEIKKLLDKS